MNIENELLQRMDVSTAQLWYRDMIEIQAYCKYAQRGFLDGYALKDWLEAELEIEKRIFYWFEEV